MTSCPSCGTALPQAAVRFCLACGHRLPATREDTVLPPGPELGPPQRPGRTKPPPVRRSLLFGLAALVLLAGGGIGAYVMLHHQAHASAGTGGDQKVANSSPTPGPASPAPSSPEQGQLTQFQTAVRGSVTARSLVKTAVTQVGACTMTPADGVAQLQQAITDRKEVIAMMSGLPMSAIPAGQPMRTDLGNVLQLSITADRDFVGWMQDPQTTQGCPASTAQDGDYTAGLQASSQAVQAKKQFLALWNPLAEQFGLPTYTALDI